MHDPNGLNPAVQISNRNFESGSLAAASFRICRREGLRPVCRNSTSLCRTPTAGFRRPSGPPCGRPNLLPANLSNPGFSSDLVFPSDTTRAPLREPFLYLAEREGFEPSIRYSRIHTFQACSFDHSDISPESTNSLNSARSLHYRAAASNISRHGNAISLERAKKSINIPFRKPL